MAFFNRRKTTPKLVVERSSCARVAVSVNNLSVAAKGKMILNNITLDILHSQVLAIIGPSGSGKSTMLNAISGLLQHDQRIDVDGQINISCDTLRERNFKCDTASVGLVFQQPNPFPLSIRENIHFPLSENGMSSKALRESVLQRVLTEVGLWDEVSDRLDSSALELSGGQQQRLCIARAIALSPSVLLLDEPCSALDPNSSKKIEVLIAQLKKRYTIVLVTHNLAQARRVADRVAVFSSIDGEGRLLEVADTTILFTQPSHPATRSFLGAESFNGMDIDQRTIA